MNTLSSANFKRSALFIALSSTLSMPTIANAQDAAKSNMEVIEVTATRRAASIQSIPMNVTALDSDVIADQNITQLSDIARWVPGLTIADQGNRSGSPIIVRGLNTNSSGPGSDAGTVATYFGEIPLYADIKIIDVDRVEVLIGPQGTLYGAGTLGGAIRYIPKKPILDETSGYVYGEVFSLAHSDDNGGEGGFVFNTPFMDDKLGVRVAFNYLNRPGFIDYNYVVREPGVSLPDPDWNDPSAVDANLKKVKDANDEETTTARVMLRWQPNDIFDSTLTYSYQKQNIGARSITHNGSLSVDNPLSNLMGKYESGYRYKEPRGKEDHLVSLELTADLGFAELTSATGYSKFKATGQRDQTDLLIRLDYSYEEFPAFSAFTREVDEEEVYTQEVRLVSTDESALSWIVGGFYNKQEIDGDSREYTPGFDEYAFENWGANQLRPDSLEYISVGHAKVTEKAVFGEISYQLTDELSVTVGGRYYDYDVDSKSALDLPLFYTLFGDYGPDDIFLEYDKESFGDDGALYKFNLSYQFTPDVLTYLTISDGFRIGGSNGVAACPDDINEIDNQIVCALPNEVNYRDDTTTNYELGMKSTWFENRFHFNAAVFHVKWENAQVTGATVNGQQPIITNAADAESNGIEIASRMIFNDYFKAYATYAYTDAKLTSDAPYLFGIYGKPGSNRQNFYDGADGDRLPGSAENQFSLGMTYSTEVFDGLGLDINYGITAQSDMISKVGLKADGETIPGYALSNMSAVLTDDDWSVSLYVDNLFDKYAFTSVRRDKGDIGLAKFPALNSNAPELQRNYGHYLTKPRQIGVRFTYNFGI